VVGESLLPQYGASAELMLSNEESTGKHRITIFEETILPFAGGLETNYAKGVKRRGLNLDMM